MKPDLNAEVDVRPRLTLRVGITGHRAAASSTDDTGRTEPHSDRLSDDDIKRLRMPVGAVLNCLKQTAQGVLENYAWAFGSSPPMLRFATSLATGADTLAAQEARNRGYTLDIVLPFDKSYYAQKQDFDATALSTFNDLCAGEHLNSLFELAGPADLTDETEVNAAYLRAGQTVMAHSDVLIAIWDGKPERGTGGTAQIVRAAQAQGLVLVHIPVADNESPRVWVPDELTATTAREGHWESLPDLSPESCAAALGGVLTTILRPPEADKAPDRLQTFFGEPWRTGSFWCLYDLLRRAFGGHRPFNLRVSYPNKTTPQAEWRDFLSAAAEIGSPRFRDHMESGLRARYLRADNAALHYSHVYRSGYILNFACAALSVFVGLVSVIWWHSYGVKAVCVLSELVLIAIILINTRWAHKRGWHQRWLDYRSLAEIFRPARLPVLLGRTPAQPFSAAGVSAGDAWVSWYARASLREIGPPTGRLNSEKLMMAIDAALGDEIDHQIKYHNDNAHLLEKLNENIHSICAWLFGTTAAVGLIFLLVYIIESAVLGPDAEKLHYTKYIKPWTTLLAASLPAFGSALFGIRATGDFVNFEKQSRRTAGALESVRQGLENERADPRSANIVGLFDMATQAMATDLRIWAMIYRWRDINLP